MQYTLYNIHFALKYVLIFAIVCRYLQIYTDFFQCLPNFSRSPTDYKCRFHLIINLYNFYIISIIIIWIAVVSRCYNRYNYRYKYLYYNSEVCVCVCVCLCTFYLKTVNGNDLILFVSWRDSSRLGFKILTKFFWRYVN